VAEAPTILKNQPIAGRLRDDQKKFAQAIVNQPVFYGVARSVSDALNIIGGD